MADFLIPKKPEKPDKEFSFPEDLSVLPGDRISFLLSKIGAFRGYVTYLLGIAVAEQKTLERQINLKTSEESRKIDDGSKTQKAIKEEVSLLPEIRELEDKYLEINNKIIRYTSLRDMYQGYIEIISREISRRQSVE